VNPNERNAKHLTEFQCGLGVAAQSEAVGIMADSTFVKLVNVMMMAGRGC
jgi:hypothetical protein